MSNCPSISVIIPFYNLQDYVVPCLNSLLSQTFTSFELICVDDGSNDRTLEQLKRMEKLDGRIRIFQKENGGLSSARNYGVEHASANYISFIDGDDVVSPWYLESMWDAMDCSCHAMVFGQLKQIPWGEFKSGKVFWEKPVEYSELDKTSLCSMLCTEECLPSACARLVPKDFYIKHPFPLERKYEEIATVGSYINMADKVIYIEEPIYGYVMRAGSIVNPKAVSVRQLKDYLLALDDFIDSLGKYLKNESESYFLLLHHSRIYRLSSKCCDSQRPELLKLYEGKRDLSRLASALSVKNAGFAQKMRLLIYCLLPTVYLTLMDQIDRKKRG